MSVSRRELFKKSIERDPACGEPAVDVSPAAAPEESVDAPGWSVWMRASSLLYEGKASVCAMAVVGAAGWMRLKDAVAVLLVLAVLLGERGCGL